VGGGGTVSLASGFGGGGPLKPSLRHAPFDYDFDGNKDFVVFRPSEGYRHPWDSNFDSEYYSALQFGTPTDIVEAADYDGDEKADFAK
jgi:hypothetical protein